MHVSIDTLANLEDFIYRMACDAAKYNRHFLEFRDVNLLASASETSSAFSDLHSICSGCPSFLHTYLVIFCSVSLYLKDKGSNLLCDVS